MVDGVVFKVCVGLALALIMVWFSVSDRADSGNLPNEVGTTFEIVF